MLKVCLLGLFPSPVYDKVGNRFLDLALELAKRQNAMTWKSLVGTVSARWETALRDRARAEDLALRREEARDGGSEMTVIYGSAGCL
ncbi:hypothetical protein NDU88_005959 [Pleurodeles waltl]|uniref:Uncharacterized protein n=1 Tax=Pleurodeles waltl TaxID=8319 RepID=A0AAV7N5U3_PLEWA|nr:hypothetical protein NDU88_005959 [Pleurodeles waltl]